MNVLFFSEIFPDADDPSRGAFNYELCRSLSADNDVRVIAPRAWTQAVPYLWSGRSYRTRPHPDGPDLPAMYPVYWYTPKMFRDRYGDFFWRSSLGAVRRLSRSFTPDAVLSYWAHPDGEAGLRAARAFGVPSVVIVGGSDVLVLPNCPKRGARVRHVLRETDAVITISEGLRERVLELGADPKRVHTIPQGINPRTFFPADRQEARDRLVNNDPAPALDGPVLLWVGRMVDVKRLDVLIAAAAELRRRGRTFRLCLAGDGPRRDRIHRIVAEQNLQGHVHFAGSLPPEALGEWYRAADVTVLSSESEGLPNVLRESLACGTPFVSTDVGSIREIADERYSVLVPVGDANALADGVAAVLDGSHHEHARRSVARTWDEMAADVRSLLQQLREDRDVVPIRESVVCHVG